MKRLLLVILAVSIAHGDEYAILFDYNGNPDIPSLSHNFGSFIRTSGVGKIQEVVTISWLPQVEDVRPLTFWKGKNFDLKEGFRIAGNRRVNVRGPFKVAPTLFEKAKDRVAFLNSGQVLYRMFDWFWRGPALDNRPGGALNCQHALSDVFGFWEMEEPAWGESAGRELEAFAKSQFIGYPATHPQIWEALQGTLK